MSNICLSYHKRRLVLKLTTHALDNVTHRSNHVSGAHLGRIMIRGGR